MTDGQLSWQMSVDQAIQDIRLLVDEANELVRSTGDAERHCQSVQYHQFSPNVDQEELSRAAHSLKHRISGAVSSLRDDIRRVRGDVDELSDIVWQHRDSV